MATAQAARKIALSLPDTEERSHFGKPDFRVRGKIFAGLSSDERQASMKLPLELQTMMVEAKPKVFAPAAGGWGRSGWTYVELAHVDVDELRQLVVEAWQLIAKRIAPLPGGEAPRKANPPAKSGLRRARAPARKTAPAQTDKATRGDGKKRGVVAKKTR